MSRVATIAMATIHRRVVMRGRSASTTRIAAWVPTPITAAVARASDEDQSLTAGVLQHGYASLYAIYLGAAAKPIAALAIAMSRVRILGRANRMTGFQ